MKFKLVLFLFVSLICILVGKYLYNLGGKNVIDESELKKPKLKTKMLFAVKSQGLIMMIVGVLAFAMGILKIIIG
ncbi:MAG: hypothetical protein IPP30_04365 [Flavobacterium sp.]|nr:hypothetical protein [Flavobacterium sp.]